MKTARNLFPALLAGLLFGAGLVLSDMASPVRVLGFLSLDADWDPTLAWVMASALAIALPGYAWAARNPRPLVTGTFLPPPSRKLDRALLGGAAIFGLGWGLAGYCPGPAIVNAGLGVSAGWWFVPAMLLGAWLARVTEQTRP